MQISSEDDMTFIAFLMNGLSGGICIDHMKVRSSKCYGFRPPTVEMPSSLVLALGTYVVGWLLRFVYLYDSYIGTVMLYVHIYIYIMYTSPVPDHKS